MNEISIASQVWDTTVSGVSQRSRIVNTDARSANAEAALNTIGVVLTNLTNAVAALKTELDAVKAKTDTL